MSKSVEVLVVGAGPAGIAAACSAAPHANGVALVDDNPSPGGQIWRGGQSGWTKRLRSAPVDVTAGQSLIDIPEPGVAFVTGNLTIQYQKLILATGARELLLPFPGWTLPNVVGAGGLQALVKGGLAVKGKRVVVAGSGPLLLAVGAYLRSCGAVVPLIAEQAPFSRLAHFGLSLIREPARLAQATVLRMRLARTRYVTRCRPVGAEGNGRVSVVKLTTEGRTWNEPCDYLACGFGLVPNLEAPLLLGCEVDGGFVRVDEWQQTSVPDVYCAGEITGIGGVDLAVTEGRIAGLVTVDRKQEARRLFAKRDRGKTFERNLAEAFALDSALRDLANRETIVCRCEDISLGKLSAHKSWRAAKLHTRCGMGPCQGRVCGAAAEFLLGWQLDSVRPPLFPAPLDRLGQ